MAQNGILNSVKNGFVCKLCANAEIKKGFNRLKPFVVAAPPSGLEPETL
jgi:hypothetical protein